MEHVTDRIADCLDREETVPDELVAELLTKMTPLERELWIRILMRFVEDEENS